MFLQACQNGSYDLISLCLQYGFDINGCYSSDLEQVSYILIVFYLIL